MLHDIAVQAIASIITAVLGALTAKVAFSRWKSIAVSLLRTTVWALVGAVVIFASVRTIDAVASYREGARLQDRIDRYVNGHAPMEFAAGWRVQVIRLEPLVLALTSPGDAFVDASAHPLRQAGVLEGVAGVVIDEGYPGMPIWATFGRRLSESEWAELSQTSAQ